MWATLLYLVTVLGFISEFSVESTIKYYLVHFPLCSKDSSKALQAQKEQSHFHHREGEKKINMYMCEFF